MTPKIRNILIFVGIGLVLILAYVFFLKPSPAQPALTSTTDASATGTTGDSTVDANAAITQNFLTLLLSVKGITLDDSIFSTPAFNSLQDSTIVLTQDGTQGRPNPFAPIGADSVATAPATSASAVTTSDSEGLLAPTQIDTTPPAPAPAKAPPAKTTSKTTTKTVKTGTTTK